MVCDWAETAVGIQVICAIQLGAPLRLVLSKIAAVRFVEPPAKDLLIATSANLAERICLPPAADQLEGLLWVRRNLPA